jgi:hypothetical protein
MKGILILKKPKVTTIVDLSKFSAIRMQRYEKAKTVSFVCQGGQGTIGSLYLSWKEEEIDNYHKFVEQMCGMMLEETQTTDPYVVVETEYD